MFALNKTLFNCDKIFELFCIDEIYFTNIKIIFLQNPNCFINLQKKGEELIIEIHVDDSYGKMWGGEGGGKKGIWTLLTLII